MKVTVKYYAKYRDIAGKMQDELEFEKVNLEELINKVEEMYPKLKNEKINLIVLNGRFVKDVSAEIKDGDTVSLFPPVSGG